MTAIAQAHACGCDHRSALWRQFGAVIELNPRLDRTLVSHQANHGRPFFNWLKYKEAFSATLVEDLLTQAKPSTQKDLQTCAQGARMLQTETLEQYGRPGGTLLDPFAGIGTALFVAQSFGMSSIGIELMPVGFQVGTARLAAMSMNPESFARKVSDAAKLDWRDYYDASYAYEHIPITAGAFPEETEQAIAGYRAYCSRKIRNSGVRQLFELAGLAVLESVSYTRKDGQYLRWDHRARKPRIKTHFDKGQIRSFGPAVGDKLRSYLSDLRSGRHEQLPLFPRYGAYRPEPVVDFRRGSCLEILPELPSDSIDTVITSPPYCNRYDYTRTYALELAYLGFNAEAVKRLRQQLLSCTVENRQKCDELLALYSGIGGSKSYGRILAVFEQQTALHEVLRILEDRARQGTLNNTNIPRMVKNYFLEMCFVIFELARLLRRGGHIIMVNDNVRYAGEEVPVDLILSDFAKKFGLEVKHIWTLPRGKGNSSQQMGNHGRMELRKCVYVWEKPLPDSVSKTSTSLTVGESG